MQVAAMEWKPKQKWTPGLFRNSLMLQRMKIVCLVSLVHEYCQVGWRPKAASTCLGSAMAPHDVHGSYGGVHVSRMTEGGDKHTVAERRRAPAVRHGRPPLPPPLYPPPLPRALLEPRPRDPQRLPDEGIIGGAHARPSFARRNYIKANTASILGGLIHNIDKRRDVTAARRA